MKKHILIIHIMSIFLGLQISQAAVSGFDSFVTSALSKRYPGARIVLKEEPKLIKGDGLRNLSSVEFMGDDHLGRALFRSQNGNETVEFSVSFEAWIQVPVIQRRIRLGEKLDGSLFKATELNVAQGAAREQRGLIIPWGTDFSRLEAHQTLIEGQYVLWSAVKPVPDVQRLSPVKVNLISTDLTVSAQGVTQEEARVGSFVRVHVGKNKRELVGTLLSDGSVEVKL